MDKISQKQIEAILSLDGATRYSHFIKQVVGFDEVWGLYNEGWVLVSTDEGETLFPVWPAKEYAELCATNIWSEYHPHKLSLEVFMDDLIPALKEDQISICVFLTPQDKGITPRIEQILNDLNQELEWY